MNASLLSPAIAARPDSFGSDVEFLRQHTALIVLGEAAGLPRVAVAPAYQGRVMTSSLCGNQGRSFGWVNRDLIASGKVQPHINVYGGEDRFWLGPEGGQFSIFFAPGAKFELADWQTPAVIDTEPFQVVEQRDDQVVCRREFSLTNYSGARFQLEVTRTIRLLDAAAVLKSLGTPVSDKLPAVAYETVNVVKNTGKEPWRKETGLLSIWILGMYNASPASTVVVPFKTGPESQLGPIVNDSYFGKVPSDRLRVDVQAGVLFFKADANSRGKIGIAPRRAKPVLGSYDAAGQLLTLVDYTLPEAATDYVNSMWELQKQPFAGDVVNSYNDGAPQPGAKQLGRFYELETSSPALALAPGASARHRHGTLHLTGTPEALDAISRAVLGAGLNAITNAFAP